MNILKIQYMQFWFEQVFKMLIFSFNFEPKDIKLR